MTKTMVAVAQIGADLGQVADNVRRVCDTIRKAASEGVQFVVFPETILNGYMFDTAEAVQQTALELDGPELGTVIDTCRAAGLVAVVGLIEDAGSTVYNTAALIGPDGLIGTYRKQHIPYLGADRFITPGPAGAPAVFDTPIGRVGLAICYDIRFPESARCLALAGADIIAQPSVWPDTVDIIANHMVRVRAAENHVYLVVVSRGDVEAGIQFRGNSQIIDPRGNVLGLAEKGDALVTAEIDLAFSAEKRIVVQPGEYEVSLFEDRRPESYTGITSPA
ncbi:MAG TPA: carbon-nitrogen hydrolase family protein [Jatrophihabitans sp.]|nr:carbon-nitrogen hydrolase family protein [Jatrophihabitans sp.]